MALEWLDNNEVFFEEAKDTLANNIDYDNITNIKLLLGIIDNIRNYLLILLNQQIVNNQIEKNVMVNLETLAKDSLMYKLYNSLISTENLMKNNVF